MITYSSSEARANFEDILDASQRGKAVTISRDGQTSAVVDGTRLREHFAATISSKPEAEMDDSAWVMTIPGIPISVEASSHEDAVMELVLALHEYADDWHGPLGRSPNHADSWSLVQLVELSTDEQLEGWVRGHVGSNRESK